VFAYKGNTSSDMSGREGKEKEREREREKERERERGSGAFQDPFRRLCSTLSDMLTDRQADARANLFSIRPMHFKLIVPRSPYPVIILFVSLRHAAWNNSRGKRQKSPRSVLFSLDTSYR